MATRACHLRRSVWGLVAAAALGLMALAPSRGQAQRAAPPTSDADAATDPSVYGVQTSRRWAFGETWQRRNLVPVANPNPDPQPQPARDHPFDVAIARDGSKVWIGLVGSELEPGHALAVYDVAAGRIIKRIELAAPGAGPPALSPYRLSMHPGGRFLLVTSRLSNFATLIDTRDDTVAAEVPLDFYSQGVVFDASGSVAWVANRYLDQVLEFEVRAAGAEMALRPLGGLDAQRFVDEVHPILAKSCGAAACHDRERGGFVAGRDGRASFVSALAHVVPGDPAGSRLLRAPVRGRHGGYADQIPRMRGHAGGVVVFADPARDPRWRRIADWIRAGGPGPGIPVGNPRSKPKTLALSTNGRHLFVGNTGTGDIAVVDTRTRREVGSIGVQNVVNDLKIHHSDATGHDYLLVTTEGVGFGVGRERDPWGGESWQAGNPAAHFSVWRDPKTGRVLPREDQTVLGPFDAVDGTAAIKFRDIQNDLLIVDLSRLQIPAEPLADGPRRLLNANRYEAHRGWVRYTSDTAESTWGDIKGDIPPELMRVVGALPEKMALVGDQLFVTMQATNQVQRWRIDAAASDPADMLVPVAVYATGLQPIGVVAGPAGTAAAGKLFVANFLGGTLTVIDTASGRSHEVVVDASIVDQPVPATGAERGEVFVHSALLSSDGDTSCFHCHYLDTGDGRPWGVSQVVGQQYLPGPHGGSSLVIGGTMGVPQMRGLFAIQPFFLEGTLSAYEARSMIQEHAPADDFRGPLPGADYGGVEAHYELPGAADIQSRMDAASDLDANLEERRDEMFRDRSMALFGKAFTLRDFVRFVGDWQVTEPHLLPNPFDIDSAAVRRGEALFHDARVGCAACHPRPNFARKDLANNAQQAIEPVVTLSARDAAFTLIGLNRLDAINGVRRDLEPHDGGRVEETQGHFTISGLRGIWDRPPVFLHNGMARTLREVLLAPGHPGLRRLKYEPMVGGEAERPGRLEVGFNMTWLFAKGSPQVRAHRAAGGRLGFDTHGGTSHLKAAEVDDLVAFLQAIE